MNKLTDRPPLSRTDKLCLAALAGVIPAVSLVDWAMDTAASRSEEADRSAEVVADNVYFGDSKREGGYGRQESYSGGDGGYSAPTGGYPAQPGPDSEFSELTTDDGNLPF